MTDAKQMAAICPLCGGDNQCAIAAGRPAESCWCQSATISEDAKARAADTALERCLCPACGKSTGVTIDAG